MYKEDWLTIITRIPKRGSVNFESNTNGFSGDIVRLEDANGQKMILPAEIALKYKTKDNKILIEDIKEHLHLLSIPSKNGLNEV